MKVTQKYNLIQAQGNIKVDLNNNNIADKEEPDFYLNLTGPRGEKDKFWSNVMILQNLVAGRSYLPDSLLSKSACLGETNSYGGIHIESLGQAFTKEDGHGNITEKFVSASAVAKRKADENSNIGTLKITTETVEHD